jgi:hypothetical protein
MPPPQTDPQSDSRSRKNLKREAKRVKRPGISFRMLLLGAVLSACAVLLYFYAVNNLPRVRREPHNLSDAPRLLPSPETPRPTPAPTASPSEKPEPESSASPSR